MEMSRREASEPTGAAVGVTELGAAPGMALMPRRTGIGNLKAHEGGVNALAFSPDGKTLASAGGDGLVKIWNLATGKEAQVLPVQPKTDQTCTLRVRAIAFSPDGKTLASGADHDVVKLWDLSTGKVRSVLDVKDRNSFEAVTSICFAADGTRLAAAIARATLRTIPSQVSVWDLATGKELSTIEGAISPDPVVAFVPPEGKALALSGACMGTPRGITIHDAMTGARRGELLTPHCHLASRMAFSPEGTTIATVESGSTIEPVRVPYYQLVLWKTNPVTAVAISEAQTEAITSLAYSPDGKRLATAGWMGTVAFWKVPTMHNYSAIHGVDPVLAVAFSPDGSLLAWGHISGTVAFWR